MFKTFLTFLFIMLFSISARAEKIVLIVHAQNPIIQITKNQLQDLYFKRNRIWPNGSAVRFFDRDELIRSEFLSQYLKKTTRQVDQYWIAQKFNTGDTAPTMISSDAMTMSLVSRFPGGIGYITLGSPLNKDVKTIEVTE